eukprot:403338417
MMRNFLKSEDMEQAFIILFQLGFRFNHISLAANVLDRVPLLNKSLEEQTFQQNLRILALNRNGIKEFSLFQTLLNFPSLEELDVSLNQIQNIEDINLIQEIQEFPQLQKQQIIIQIFNTLHRLFLSSNDLRTLESLKHVRFPNLKMITFFGNKLGLVNEDQLKENHDLQVQGLLREANFIKNACPNLFKLSLDGNPITTYIPHNEYKQIILEIFLPSLKILDNEQI